MPSRLSGLFPPTPPSPRAPSTTTDAPSTTTTPASSTSRPAPGPSPAEVPTAHIAAMPPRATPAPPAPRTGLSPLGARFVAADEQAVALQASRGRARDALAVDHEANPRDAVWVRNMSYVRYVDQARQALAAAGLPTSAEGVTVRVVDFLEDGYINAHGSQVARVVGGAYGFAQNCDLRLDATHISLPVDKFVADWGERLQLSDDQRARCAQFGQAPQAMRAGTLTDPAELGQSLVNYLIQGIHRRRADIADTVANKDPHGPVAILNMSYGYVPLVGAKLLTRFLARRVTKDDPDGSLAEAIRATTADGTIGSPDVVKFLLAQLDRQLQDPATAAAVAEARAALAQDVADAQKRGVLLVTGAGNNGGDRADHDLDHLAPIDRDIEGLITVGSVWLGNDVDDPADDKVSAHSSPGEVDIAAVGSDVPSMSSPAGSESGTSLASPMVAAVAALMVKANPVITAEAIVEILLGGQVTRDIPGDTRDGVGMLDPVKAVAAAAAWRPAPAG